MSTDTMKITMPIGATAVWAVLLKTINQGMYRAAFTNRSTRRTRNTRNPGPRLNQDRSKQHGHMVHECNANTIRPQGKANLSVQHHAVWICLLIVKFGQKPVARVVPGEFAADAPVIAHHKLQIKRQNSRQIDHIGHTQAESLERWSSDQSSNKFQREYRDAYSIDGEEC